MRIIKHDNISLWKYCLVCLLSIAICWIAANLLAVQFNFITIQSEYWTPEYMHSPTERFHYIIKDLEVEAFPFVYRISKKLGILSGIISAIIWLNLVNYFISKGKISKSYCTLFGAIIGFAASQFLNTCFHLFMNSLQVYIGSIIASLIFGAIPGAILGFFCTFLVQPIEPETEEETELKPANQDELE